MKLHQSAVLSLSVAGVAFMSVFFQSRLAVAQQSITPPATQAGSFLGDEFQLGDTDWMDDFPEESKEGSPVKPGKVTICHKGMTIIVSQNAVAAHQAHGDTLGPCGPKDTAYTIVCHEGKALVVTLIEAAGYVRRGATMGLCTGDDGTIMCDGKKSVAVAEADVAKRLKDGWTPGPCNGKEAVVICEKNKTVVVPKEQVEARVKAGATPGPCPKKK
jgi:hypothetical protein